MKLELITLRSRHQLIGDSTIGSSSTGGSTLDDSIFGGSTDYACETRYWSEPATHSGKSQRTRSQFKAAILVSVTISLLGTALGPALACGPFPKYAIFVLRAHPDFPLKRFAAGELGIIKPDYARSYLVVAYRYLSGIKTSPKKQNELNALWEHRLTNPDGELQKAVELWSVERKKVQSAPLKDPEVYKCEPYSYGFVNYNADAFIVATETLKSKIAKFGVKDNRVKEWVIAQDQVFGVTPSENSSGDGAELQPLPADADKESQADRNYQIACRSFYNGNYDDAVEKFQAIAKDPTSRWQKWGDYLAARAYCRKGTKDEKPEVADLKKAAELIDKIINAKESSPLIQKAQAIKHFLEYRLDPAGRAKATVTALTSDGENANLTEALGDYTVILDRIQEKNAETQQTPTTWNSGNEDDNIGLSPTRGVTQTGSQTGARQSSESIIEGEFLGAAAAVVALMFSGMHLIWWRSKPKGGGANWISTIAVVLSISLLSCSLVACSQKANTPTASAPAVGQEVPADPAQITASQVVLNDEMTKWILNFQEKSPQSLEKAISEWQESKSLPWLVSVICRIEHSNPQTDAVLAAADKIPSDSPAFLTVTYHRIRLLKESGKVKEASDRLLAFLKETGDKLSPSTRGSFYELGVGIVGTLSEFAKLAAPNPACVSAELDELPEPIDDLAKTDGEGKYLVYQRCLTPQAANIVNEVSPLSTIAALANDQSLPVEVRSDIAQVGWVRSVILKDEKTAMSLSPVLTALQPRLGKVLSVYNSASSGDEKELAGLSVILHNPAMRPYVTSGLPRQTAFDKIDNYRDNWWCADPPTINHGYDESGEKKKDPTPQATFLTPEEQKQGLKQFKDLESLGTAPNLFAQRILKLAKAKPKDPRFAEVLHLVVTSTRYGCTDDKTTLLSKQAFQELHKNYPGNPWTKKTKFWF